MTRVARCPDGCIAVYEDGFPTTDKDDFVRANAAVALGRIGGEKAVKPLSEALKNKGAFLAEEVKEVAFDALEKICRRIGKRIPLETSKTK